MWVLRWALTYFVPSRNSQCKEGAKYANVHLRTRVTFLKWLKHSSLSRQNLFNRKLNVRTVTEAIWNGQQITPAHLYTHAKRCEGVIHQLLSSTVLTFSFLKSDWTASKVGCMMHRASSRWSLFLYCPMRKSDQITIGKTHPTLLGSMSQKVLFRIVSNS